MRKTVSIFQFAATSRLVVELVPSTSQKISKVTNVSEATTTIQAIEVRSTLCSERGALTVDANSWIAAQFSA